jgi:hypothetical protein
MTGAGREASHDFRSVDVILIAWNIASRIKARALSINKVDGAQQTLSFQFLQRLYGEKGRTTT